MPEFAFTARDSGGQPASGVLSADSIAQAGQLLREQGKYPITVVPKETVAEIARSSAATGLKVPRADVIQFSTQLAVMIETGVTLVEALECIAAQATRPQLRALAGDVAQRVSQGSDFSAALAKHPRSFPKLYVALVQAAEKSGMLSKLLNRATNYLRDEQEIVRKVKGAVTYPGIMFAFAITTTVFLLVFVLPKFTVIYANRGATLPLPTKIMMTISESLIHHWMYIVGAIVAMTIGWIAYVRTEGGRHFWHRVQLRIPLIGAMFRKMHLARALRMIGTMTSAGVSLLESVQTANELCDNNEFRSLWTRVGDQIQEGKQLSEPLTESYLVPRSIAQMIHSAEKSGKLAFVMEQVAQYSEQELKEKIAELTRYIEPAMIVIMGAIIGTVALALMLPIFTISKVVAN